MCQVSQYHKLGRPEFSTVKERLGRNFLHRGKAPFVANAIKFGINLKDLLCINRHEIFIDYPAGTMEQI